MHNRLILKISVTCPARSLNAFAYLFTCFNSSCLKDYDEIQSGFCVSETKSVIIQIILNIAMIFWGVDHCSYLNLLVRQSHLD